MAESDAVAGFKTFAQDQLLALLRPEPGNSLAKQTAYDEIRKAYAEAAGWPAELDAVEPGPSKMPCWLNRLHWVVADLVQAGCHAALKHENAGQAFSGSYASGPGGDTAFNLKNELGTLHLM